MASAPVFVAGSAANASIATASTSSPVTVAAPGGVVAGNVLLAFYYISNSFGALTITYTPPAGWAQVGTVSAGTYGACAWFWKVATGSEPSTYTFTGNLSSSTQSSPSVTVTAWSGVSTTAPIDAEPVYTTLATKTGSPVAPASTAVADHTALLCAYGGYDGYTSFTAPPGMTTRASTFQSTFVANAVASLNLAATGTTGTRTATVSPTSRGVWSTIALAGAATGTTAPLTATGSISTSGTAALTARGSVTASGSTAPSGAAALTGRGQLAASGTTAPTGSAAVQATAAVAATGSAGVTGTAALTAQQGITANGQAGSTGAASLTARAAITATGSTSPAGAAALTVQAGVTASGTTTPTGTAAITARGALTAGGSTSTTGNAALTTAGQQPLTASGTTSTTGQAALTTTAGLAAAGGISPTGTAQLELWAVIVAAGTVSPTGQATLTTTAALAASGATALAGQAALQALQLLVAAGAVTVDGTASIQGGPRVPDVRSPRLDLVTPTSVLHVDTQRSGLALTTSTSTLVLGE